MTKTKIWRESKHFTAQKNRNKELSNATSRCRKPYPKTAEISTKKRSVVAKTCDDSTLSPGIFEISTAPHLPTANLKLEPVERWYVVETCIGLEVSFRFCARKTKFIGDSNEGNIRSVFMTRPQHFELVTYVQSTNDTKFFIDGTSGYNKWKLTRTFALEGLASKPKLDEWGKIDHHDSAFYQSFSNLTRESEKLEKVLHVVTCLDGGLRYNVPNKAEYFDMFTNNRRTCSSATRQNSGNHGTTKTFTKRWRISGLGSFSGQVLKMYQPVLLVRDC